nr:glycosyltransferase family 39 protein [uncultured Butyrivibrio sp.]
MKKKLQLPFNKTDMFAFFTMILSFLLRAYYVSIISIYDNQHDGGNPFEEGHLAYIAHFLNNKGIPDFDISKVDQFWHPPLTYYLSSLLLKASWALFPGQNGNYEIAQAIPLLSVTLSIIIIYKILRLLFPKNPLGCNIALVFAAFHPSFVYRSATINSDAPATLIAITILYLLIIHVQNPRYLRRLEFKSFSLSINAEILSMVALFTLGMWVKKSIMLVAVPVGLVLLYELIAEKKNDFWQALVLLLITSPLSFGWYIYMRLKWNIPFNFVWNVSYPRLVSGHISDNSIIKRIMDFSPAHFGYAYTFVGSNTEAIDINPLTLLIKTSANDLWIWTYVNGKEMTLSYLLLLLRVVFTVLFFVGVLLFIQDKKYTSHKNKLTIVSYTIISLISFYSFSFSNPYICSMNYRYIEPIVLCECAIAAYLCGKSKMTAFLGAMLSAATAATVVFKIFFFR